MAVEPPSEMRQVLEHNIAMSLRSDAHNGGGRTSSTVHGMGRDSMERVVAKVQGIGYKCRACFGETSRIEVVEPNLGAGQMPHVPFPSIGLPLEQEPFHRPSNVEEQFRDQMIPGLEKWDSRIEEAIAIDMVRAVGGNGATITEFFGFDEEALDNIRGILIRSGMTVTTRMDQGVTLSCQIAAQPYPIQ